MDRFPRQDAELASYLKAMAKSAQENAATLGLSAGEVQELVDTADAFVEARRKQIRAFAQAKSAKTGKDIARREATEALRRLSRVVAANPDVAPVNKMLLGLPAERQSHSKHPNDPQGLVGRHFYDGRVQLRWKANGNPWGTTYLIVAYGNGRGKQIIGTTTKCSYMVGGNEAVDATFLSVCAQRRNERSLSGGAVSRWPDCGMRKAA